MNRRSEPSFTADFEIQVRTVSGGGNSGVFALDGATATISRLTVTCLIVNTTFDGITSDPGTLNVHEIIKLAALRDWLRA